MSLDDLLKGLGAFQQGMTQYGVGQGIAAAKEQVDQINSMQMKEMEKRQALSQVSNQLMMQLSQTGADASTIQQAAMPFAQKQLKDSGDFLTLGMEKGDKEVTRMGQELQAQESAITTGEREKDRDLARELQRGQIANANRLSEQKGLNKLGEREFKAIEKQAMLFEQKNADVFKGMNLAKTAKQLLGSDNPVADKAVLNSLVKASGDTGVITDSDRQAFAGSEAWDAKIKRWSNKITTGKLDDASRAELMKLAEIYEKRAGETARSNRDRLAKTLSNRLGVAKEELAPQIYDFEADDAMSGTKKAAAAAAPAAPAGLPEGTVEVVVRVKGQPVKAFKLPNNKIVIPKAAP